MLQPDGVTQRPYQELLARLRDTFPAPVSDRKHDAYFVFSILRALDQVDDLKSEVPLLGRPRTLDYAAAERAELSEEGRSVEEVARQLVGQLEGMPTTWPRPAPRRTGESLAGSGSSRHSDSTGVRAVAGDGPDDGAFGDRGGARASVPGASGLRCA